MMVCQPKWSSTSMLMLIVLALASPARAGGDDAGSEPPPMAVEALRQIQSEHFPVQGDGGGTSWNTGAYVYDPAGNISAIGSQYFLYDPTGRLVAAHVTAAAGSLRQDYDYDEYGNMTGTEMGGVVTSIPTETATNRLNGPSAQYDAAGNMTQTWSNGDTITYQYDSLNMLQRLSDSEGNDIVYVYTADDQRIWTYDLPPNISHWAIRGLDGKVLRDYVQTGTAWSVGKDYFYRDGQLLAAAVPSGVTEHFSLDHLGTPRLITDQNHNRIGFHVYFPFGIEWHAAGQHETPAETMRFTGHERDKDLTGSGDSLDYMHARYYSAKQGRFLTVDPTWASAVPGKPQSWNRYSYVRNNPMIAIDPTGESLRLVGSDTRQTQVEQVANDTLHNVDLVIAPNGDTTLKPNNVQGPPSPQQAALQATLTNAIDDTTTVTIALTSNSTQILMDHFDSSTIDIGDIGAVAAIPGAPAAGILGHSIEEQFQKQVKGRQYPQAHAIALRTEDAINGSKRGQPFGDVSRAGTGTMFQPYTRGGHTFNMVLTLTNYNVTCVDMP